MGNRTRDRVIFIRTDEKLQTELKKQGVNINQIAKALNSYGNMDMKQPLQYTEYRYKKLKTVCFVYGRK